MSILIAILCFVPLLHCAYFSSSMIESIEAKKEVDYEDNLGSFMGMLILPIGIWKFQPMIRKAMEGRSQDLTLQV